MPDEQPDEQKESGRRIHCAPMIAADSQQRSREQGELIPGDCGGRLKKEKRKVISAPSARGKGNCVPLICRLIRPSLELVFAPSRKFSQKIDRIELSYIPARRAARVSPIVALRDS
jgi:hypothetical protein